MYCNAACKKRHRKKHKKECEEHVKRAAEHAAKVHDEKLFKQPPPLEDCPICMIRLPALSTGRVYMSCCGKTICRGCVYAFQSRAAEAGRSKEDNKCPFCRTPAPSEEEMIQRYKQRVEMNDPKAMQELGFFFAEGQYGFSQNYTKALELWQQAADLGHATAYNNIGHAHQIGLRVERDEKRAIHYWELAAMSGCVAARHNLGVKEHREGYVDRALKHFMIAGRDGYSGSLELENIKKMLGYGQATKDDYAKALRSYQAYLDEIKSDQRDKAVAFSEDYKYYD